MIDGQKQPGDDTSSASEASTPSTLDIELQSEQSARPASAPTSPRKAGDDSGARRGSTRSAKLTSGDELELRVAHVWFVEGSFSRRAINLRYADAGEAKDITDIDLLVVDFDGALRTTLTIGESKGGTGRGAPSPIDRSMWLRGLRELTRAHRAELTVAQRQTARARRLALKLGVELQAIADVEQRERTSGANDLRDVGPHAASVALARDTARQGASADPDLNRAYQYLRGDVWFAEPWAAAKRLVATVKLLGSRWAPGVADAEQDSIRWMLSEAIVAFVLTATRLAGAMLTTDPDRVARDVAERLAEGSAPMSEMKQLSESIDHYLSVVLSRHNVPRAEIVRALGAFQPSAPPWSEAFSELIRRLGGSAADARELPRYADLVVVEHLLRRRAVDQADLKALGLDERDGVRRLLRTVIAFLEGQAGLPRDVVAEVVDRR